ncbi:MAG: YceI family protein [Phycisphaeraceae bacterium]|nr:MAG: YceI family protein [Phycisphaeraceae bacterium]
MTRRRTASIVCTSLAAAGLAAAGFTGFAGATGVAHAEALDMESVVQVPTYTVDPVHSGVAFSVRHRGVGNFHGRFNKVEGTFTFDPASPAAGSFKAAIPVESIDTGIEKRDEHLKSADFFNARQYPTVTFESTAIETTEKENVFAVTGDMTMHGETKPITATLEWIGEGQDRGHAIAGFEANFTIKRSDFGITTFLAPDGGEGGGLGNTVHLTVFVEGAVE